MTYETYNLMPVLKSGYVIMGTTMCGVSMGLLYGEAWTYAIMGIGYLILFTQSTQTNIEV